MLDRTEKAQPAGAPGVYRSAALRYHQAAERSDILNVGGFSDEVFTVIDNFVNGRYGSAHWLEEIEAVTL